ncbi:MAG: ATP-binding cassette domain-containing protein [Firmicutes bacterium]|nr:ATP-binding cassette domain-containing protein [Bacillota bacterium]
MKMIQVENLEKYFKKTIKQPGFLGSVKSLFHSQKEIVKAVDDISFHVDKGEILGFIGPNGAGKSTVIKMLTGILTPTGGSCVINGQNPQKNRKKYVKEIGVVFGQRTQLWWDLPLTETYTVLKEIYEIDDAQFKKQMAFLNEVLELDPFITSPVRTLSLGQRMRADIAASLLHNPKVLFLDEPTIGLDVVVKDNIRKAIAKINQEEGTTVILTTHDLEDISSLCKRIVMIDHGKKVYDGSLYNLKQKYGQMRELNFEAVDSESAATLDYANTFAANALEEGDLTVTTEGAMVSVGFNTDKISVEKMLNYTLSKIHVKDINVKDADIEEIIRRLYKSGVEDA